MPITVREAIQWAASFLHQALSVTSDTYKMSPKSDQERIVHHESMTLLEHATGWSRTKILVNGMDALPADMWSAYQDVVRQRGNGIPLQYILGEAWFYGRPFSVRPGCLIPRPETEVLADLAISWIRRHYTPAGHSQATVVDIGTGSGCLAVTIALEVPSTIVHAVDVSDAALSIARSNAARHSAPVQFTLADGIEWLRGAGGQGIECAVGVAGAAGDARADDARIAAGTINVLVSNPPYIPSHEVDALDAEVREYEPRLALDGGADGLDIYRLFSKGGAHPFADGPAALFLEVGAGQAQDVRLLFADHEKSRWPGWTFHVAEDLRGVERIVWGERRM